MIYTIELEVRASGNFSEQELSDFVEFELGGGSLSNDNSFIEDESEAEITRVDVVSIK